MYLYENTVDRLSSGDREIGRGRGFPLYVELIFPAESVGRAPSPAAFDFVFGMQE